MVFDLSFLSEEEYKAIENGEFNKISPASSIKLQELSSQYAGDTQENAIYKSNLDRPQSVTETTNETGESPISIMDRFKLGFGNNQGNLDYLRSKGENAVYRDGELKIQNDDGSLTPIDPSPSAGSYLKYALKGLALPILGPGVMYGDEVVKDLPGDIAELTSDIPSMVLQEGLGAGGALVGTAAGSPVLGYLLRMLGSTVGSGAGEKLRETVGGELGTYKKGDDESFLNDDTKRAALIGGVTSTLPAAYRGTKKIIKGVGKAGLKAKIPQRLYANSTGLTDTLADNPRIVDDLMDSGLFGTRDSIIAKAKSLSKTQSEILDQELKKFNVSLDDVKDIFGKISKDAPSGSVSAQKRASNTVLDDFENKSFWKSETNKIPVNNPSEVTTKSVANLEIPDDDVLRQLYKKQYPKESINLEVAPYKTTASVPSKKISFNEFKNKVISENGSAPDDNILVEMYNNEISPNKIINRTYPAPKGKIEAPTFEQFRKEKLQQFIKQKRPNPNSLVQEENVLNVETPKKANALDLNTEKRNLQNIASKTFGKSNEDISLKEVQGKLSTAIKQAIEKASGDPEKIAQINKLKQQYGALLEGMGIKESKDISKPLVSGVDSIVGAASLPVLAKKLGVDQAKKSTLLGTTSGTYLKKMLDVMASSNVDRTTKQKLAEIISSSLLRQLSQKDSSPDNSEFDMEQFK